MPVTVKRTDFNDVEALQDVLQDSRSEVMQLGRGRMFGTMTQLYLDPSFGISTGSFSRAVRTRGVRSPNRWSLAMLLQSNGLAVGRGKFDVGDLVYAAPGEERYVRFQDSTRYLVAMVDPLELEAFLAPQPGALEEMWRRKHAVLAADPITAAANVAQLQPLLDALTQHGPTMRDDVAAHCKRNILQLLTAPIRDAVTYQGARPLSAERLVRDVDHYLSAAGNRPIHISELCEYFRVHQRALHRAFNEVLNMPPITFLRRKRLGDIHAILRQGGPDVMISDVAREHGFVELGRFAACYRRMFGELPSQTLRRARRRLTAPHVEPQVRHWLPPAQPDRPQDEG